MPRRTTWTPCPKKKDVCNITNIQVTRDIQKRLNEVGNYRLTYNETITKLLDVWDVVKKEWQANQH